jgi:hypothetical protein
MSTLTDGANDEAVNTEPVAEATEAVANTEAAERPEWLNGWEVEDDMLSNPALGPIQSKEDLLKGYINAQKMIGADKIPVPGKYAEDTEWDGVFKKLGLPELDEYNLDAGLLENKDFFEAFKKEAHEARVLPNQAQKLYNWYNEYSKNALDTMQAGIEQRQIEAEETLKEEWGEEYEANLRSARLALKAIDDTNLNAYLDETGMGDNPVMIRALSKLGSRLVDDKILGEGSALTSGKEQSQAFVNDVMANANHPARDKAHPLHKQAVRELEEHYRNLY